MHPSITVTDKMFILLFSMLLPCPHLMTVAPHEQSFFAVYLLQSATDAGSLAVLAGCQTPLSLGGLVSTPTGIKCGPRKRSLEMSTHLHW